METELRLVIGDKNLSSWSLRPWLALRQSGIPFTEILVPFEEPGWHGKVTALAPDFPIPARVPALQHGPTTIWDSLAICEYAADRFPDARLWPSEPTDRALARAVSAEMHSGFAHLRKDLSMDVTARFEPRPLAQETRADVDRILAIWRACRERAAGRDGPFLFGRFSIADAMFAPVVWRFRTYGVAVEEPHARAWYETMLALPSMLEWERDAAAEVARALAAPRAPRSPDPTTAQHCFAVIFTSQHAPGAKAAGYDDLAAAMVELTKRQPGFLGMDSARNADGSGITVCYWDSLEAIARWKSDADHQAAQRRGKGELYSRYEVRVCTVERSYGYAPTGA